MHATTSSQDYDSFELNDPELLQVLADAESSHTLKRARSESPEPMELDEKRPPTHPYAGGQAYLDSETYGASRFGGIGDFMRRKRAKLQIQNAQISQSKENAGEEEERSKLFKGLAIYINGWTEPSVQELRALIVKHGGIYQPYLDQKRIVTHVLTCSLTPAKVREFKNLKVVTPAWLVDSAARGVLLNWRDYIFRPGGRLENTQGRSTGQTSLNQSLHTQQAKAGRTQVAQSTTSMPAVSSEATPTLRSETEHYSTHPAPVTRHIESKDASPLAHTHIDTHRPHTPSPPAEVQGPMTPSKPHTNPIDPVTLEQPSGVPSYAFHKSNVHAQQAMADPAWRAAHTSAAPDFIGGYYRNSRLHHLSAWKAELRGLVMEAQEHAEQGMLDEDEEDVGNPGDIEGLSQLQSTGVSMRGSALLRSLSRKAASKGKGKAKADPSDRVIMHCDFDSFFVSAGLLDKPELKGKPVVVCHSQGTQGGASSTSEIASASYEARKFGVKGRMSLRQARSLCPDVLTLPYEFEKYKRLSLKFYTILMSHADDLQAVSVDEALIDVTSSVKAMASASEIDVEYAQEYAELIRAQVKKATGCTVSIGIAHNIMMARLATRRAKPDGSYHLLLAQLPDILAPLDIDNLHGFGRCIRKKAEEKLGTFNLGELMKKSRGVLCDALGKSTGETLYDQLRGIDERKLESDKPRKSVSCDINYGIRFEDIIQAEAFIHQMAEEVARRLDAIEVRGRSITLKLMKRHPDAPAEAPKFMGHGLCETFNKQGPLVGSGGRATSDANVIGDHACRLLRAFSFDLKELRGVSIQIQKIEPTAAPSSEAGQSKLSFITAEKPAYPLPVEEVVGGLITEVIAPVIRIRPASEERAAHQDSGNISTTHSVLELPSFSQVDRSVFDALPDDVRKELEAEYKRQSASPAPPHPVAGSSKLPVAPRHGLPLQPIAGLSRSRIAVKGTNVKRITQQLAPKNRSSVSPTKNRLFAQRDRASALDVSEAELRRIDIAPEVFAMLPRDLQREQLEVARQMKSNRGVIPTKAERKVIKPNNNRRTFRSRSRSAMWKPPPPPKAHFPDPPTLKQQVRGKDGKKEKISFTEAEDVQATIERWVNGFLEIPPNAKDVEFFAQFLVKCVESTPGKGTDAGVEKAVKVVKWWLVLLRRHWGPWEHGSSVATGGGQVETVAQAWWTAFKDVKTRLDTIARKKFGGSLSLR